jgi:predicted AAA+ superfamily ATPase
LSRTRTTIGKSDNGDWGAASFNDAFGDANTVGAAGGTAFADAGSDPRRNGGLILFANVSDDAAVAAASLLRARPRPGDDVYDAAWVSFQRLMLEGVGAGKVRATCWQSHVCALMASSDNPFSRAAERGAYAALEKLSGTEDILRVVSSLPEPDAGLFRLASVELSRVREMYAWDFGTGADNVASFPASPPVVLRRERAREALAAKDGVVAAAALASYHRAYGAGAFEEYDRYRWDGGFSGVEAEDGTRFDDLVGVERQKKALIENTEFLLRGLPASNILLYGDAGAGKSSSVKALAAEFADRGLKLVAIGKDRVAELPDALAAAAGRGLKFLFFIDDLSFDEDDDAYKSFKSVIEGDVNPRPDNVAICVTSNRRNIVREVWKDRESRDDVHVRDNLQEKRSLADRFGLTLVYSAPGKDGYLAIVTALARRAGLDADEEKLKDAALKWAVRRGGRSGRAARQFIDYCVAQRALGG